MKPGLGNRQLSAAATLIVLLAASVVHGSPQDSLAEVARRDRERRERLERPAQVYTDDDLREVRASAPATPRAAATVSEDASATAELDREREARKALEAGWRKRFDRARQRIKDAESRAWRTVIRPVVVGGSASGLIAGTAVVVPMQVREFVETEELRQARQALLDLEEELRRAGLPPGWGRER